MSNTTNLLHSSFIVILTTPLFCIGDLVTVDDKDIAYILHVTINDDSILYKVNYSIGNCSENDVEQTRCKPTTIFNINVYAPGFKWGPCTWLQQPHCSCIWHQLETSPKAT